MTMRVFRIVPAADAPEIRCTTCGEEAKQAGIGVRPEAITTTSGASGAVTTINTHDGKPLCEARTRLLLRGE